MTARQVYEYVLAELNKYNYPMPMLEDFNYLFNKAINNYVNKRYNVYDVNQQTTDDLRVLKSSAIIYPYEFNAAEEYYPYPTDNDHAHEFNMPDDYFHLLNCICTFRAKKDNGCNKAGSLIQVGASRLTADMWGQVINNYFLRPSVKHPYYYIHHVNINNELPTNPNIIYRHELYKGTDAV